MSPQVTKSPRRAVGKMSLTRASNCVPPIPGIRRSASTNGTSAPAAFSSASLASATSADEPDTTR